MQKPTASNWAYTLVGLCVGASLPWAELLGSKNYWRSRYAILNGNVTAGKNSEDNTSARSDIFPRDFTDNHEAEVADALSSLTNSNSAQQSMDALATLWLLPGGIRRLINNVGALNSLESWQIAQMAIFGAVDMDSLSTSVDQEKFREVRRQFLSWQLQHDPQTVWSTILSDTSLLQDGKLLDSSLQALVDSGGDIVSAINAVPEKDRWKVLPMAIPILLANDEVDVIDDVINQSIAPSQLTQIAIGYIRQAPWFNVHKEQVHESIKRINNDAVRQIALKELESAYAAFSSEQ